MMTFNSANSSNIMLEKEVSYLHGKLDTLEKVIYAYAYIIYVNILNYQI